MSKRAFFSVALLSVGCGSSADGAAPATGDGIAISVECRGFSMDGIKYSPGGTALPNKCKPFDPSTNNPYAVRCVDVLPGYKTSYPGDDFCILPPPPDKGVQVGIHPQGDGYWPAMWKKDFSGYSNPATTGPFEVAPGGEIEQTYRTTMDNAETRSFYRIDSRMRTGSHHMATYLTSVAGTDGWGALAGPNMFVPDGAGAFFWNSQRPNTDRPAGSLDIPDEDVGLGASVDAHQAILFDVHHFNTGNKPILREAWINAWWVDGPVTQAVSDQPLLADVNVPPETVKDLDGSLAPTVDTRVISAFGHRHAWTRRINAWIDRADGTSEPIYDSFDWLNVPTYSYDSLSKNPTANPDTQTDGAASGILTVHVGDTLRFTCHVDTTAAHAAELGVPVPTHTLTFGNKAFDAEMCILYAQTISAQ